MAVKLRDCRDINLQMKEQRKFCCSFNNPNCCLFLEYFKDVMCVKSYYTTSVSLDNAELCGDTCYQVYALKWNNTTETANQTQNHVICRSDKQWYQHLFRGLSIITHKGQVHRHICVASECLKIRQLQSNVSRPHYFR